MQAANRHALKEWAVICAALAEGWLALLIRTGGIDEGPNGFTAQHNEFWLLPTRFHQSADELIDVAEPLLVAVRAAEPPEGVLRLSLYATVEEVHQIDNEFRLAQLEGEHILAPDTLKARFHYRQPGLYVLIVRVYRLPQPIEIPDSPDYAGCHSWVELDRAISTSALQPVTSDAAFASRVSTITGLL